MDSLKTGLGCLPYHRPPAMAEVVAVTVELAEESHPRHAVQGWPRYRRRSRMLCRPLLYWELASACLTLHAPRNSLQSRLKQTPATPHGADGTPSRPARPRPCSRGSVSVAACP